MDARIDAHQHFWRPNSTEYPWMPPAPCVLRRPALPAHLKALCAPLGVVGSIAVQARQTLSETHWLLGIADADPFVLGVVGWVDLQGDALDAELDILCTNPKLRGVRHVVHDEVDVNWLLRPAVLRGLGKLARRGLVFDLLLKPPHLAPALVAVSAFPDQTFVLDHIAIPDVEGRAAVMATWTDGIIALAALPNVFCKLSGLITKGAASGWVESDFTALLNVVVAAFGYDRLMFGSDWPVLELAGTYASVVMLIEHYLTSRGATEQDARNVWCATAARVYGVPTGTSTESSVRTEASGR